MAFFTTKRSFLKAAATGDLDEVNYYLTYVIPSKFDIDAKNGTGETALQLAAINGHLDVMKALIDKKADVNTADNTGWTPLMDAARNKKPAAARLLIAAGADVNAHSDSYISTIITASRHGLIDVVKDLAAAGADLNATSRETGRTGLHWAVVNGHAPVIEFLLTQPNIRTDIVDRDGYTAAGIAKKKGEARLISMFEEKPAAPAAPAAANDSGWKLMGPARVAQIASDTDIGRRITEIFNFESRERIVISENLRTGAEAVTQPEKFETLAEDTVARAEERLKVLGGAVPDKAQKRAFNL
jgi:ankyrin repeat protein